MIKKLSNEKWQVQCYGRDKYGVKTRRRRVVHGTKSAANRVESELNKELGQLVMGYKSVSYGQFLKNEYFPQFQAEYPSEFPTLSGTLNKWCQNIMDLKMEQINMSDVMKILKQAEEHVSFNTVKKIKGYISRSFTYAMTQGFTYNPCDKIRLKNKNQQEPKPKVLTKSEIEILLAESKRHLPIWYPWYCMSVYIGTRCNELTALKRSDVSLEEGTITISKSYSRQLKKIKSTKTGDWRVISLPQQLLPLIKHLMVGPRDGFLLQKPQGLLHGKQSGILRQFCKKIGITEITYHSLRHTFCTHALANGASTAQVMSVSGHKNLRSLNIYLSLSGVPNKGVCDLLNIKLPSKSKVIPLKHKKGVI